MTISENINSQNIELWNYLSSKFDFKLIYSPTEISWRVNSNRNPIEIYTSDKVPNIPAFTHELLHVYIEDKGMSTDGDLINSIYGNESFAILTTNSLYGKIHNWCCHTKMFPYFIKMGFEDSSFIADRIKMRFVSYLLLKLRFSSNKISKMAVVDYIGHTMALLSDIESANQVNTLKSLRKLKELNLSLFIIVNDFHTNWKNSDDFNLINHFQAFEGRLDNWVKQYCK